ncbi:hypothetical protein [Thalassospira marina]|jgi:hypothetical protein|uniref:Uncharacterized protein n=1 Tax=Thalassospira marina TaxID=2048283 RepID=A0A2N3KIV0_9PROT|nr:hypothetical protein [Thalassospira marina]PKR50426.1 hypothetical protein COO20_21360 [Thalassospira marina]
METIEDIEELEKLIGQLKALHGEISVLAKKSPNDGINSFKLKLVNKTISTANIVLGDDFIPHRDFVGFNEDDLPSNSDVTFIIAQYLEEAERYRARYVIKLYGHDYRYELNGVVTEKKASPPNWSKK